ncbi:MAG: hypothetical protein ACI4LA_04225 [Emergencia sp.]
MLTIKKDQSFCEKNVPFAALEVSFPEKDRWNLDAFEALKEEELAEIRRKYEDYDRKAVFGENAYYRYFKKYKKSYPVMMQLESFLLKGRPFPKGNPVNEIAFLAELKTQILLGTHDIDRIEGDMVMFCGTEKTDFPGMRGEPVHIYPGDVSGRDDRDIIISMIAGADDRTCITTESRHIAYLFFGTAATPESQFAEMAELLSRYTRTLAPEAEIRMVWPED